MPRSTIVLGAGVAGLVAAYELEALGHEVTVLEARDQVGGAVGTLEQDGFRIEEGPNTLSGRDAERDELLERLGLLDRIVPASDEAGNRFIVRDGRPVAAPTSPASFLRTPLLSGRAKLRLLAEPFISRGEEEEETLAHFVERRLGREVLDYAVDPFVGGIYAGRPDELGVRVAFPMLHELESEHGSLLKGMVRRLMAMRSDPPDAPRRPPFTFPGGLSELPAALHGSLNRSVEMGRTVTRLDLRDDEVVVHADGPDGPMTYEGEMLVSTLPLHRLVELNVTPEIDWAPLPEVHYPPVSVWALGFRRDQVEHALDGFGVLIPSAESRFRTLGALFNSSLFPNRAPEGHVLLTAFLGGARQPELGTASEDDQLRVLLHDLGLLLGIHGAPVFTHRRHWPRAIPQYHPGYERVQDRLDDLERTLGRVAFAGNYRSGISLGDTISSGRAAARRLDERA